MQYKYEASFVSIISIRRKYYSSSEEDSRVERAEAKAKTGFLSKSLLKGRLDDRTEALSVTLLTALIGPNLRLKALGIH